MARATEDGNKCTNCKHSGGYHVSVEKPYHKFHDGTKNGYCVWCDDWCIGGRPGLSLREFYAESRCETST